MVIHIYLKNSTLIWPSDLETREKVSLNFDTDLRLRFDYQGDSFNGPGFSNLELELNIVKGFEKNFSSKTSGKQFTEINEDVRDTLAPDFHDGKRRKTSPREATSVKEKRRRPKRETSPQRNSTPELPNTGNMIENVTILFQQRYEIKNSKRHFEDEKADYITKLSLVKKNAEAGKPCDINIPVVLLNPLSALFSVISNPSVESVKNKNSDKSRSKPMPSVDDEEEGYNQIYEVSLPNINLVLLSEYKGEELIKIAIKNVFMYFRREQKKTPRTIEAAAQQNNLVGYGVALS
jgi:hypothetical protein